MKNSLIYFLIFTLTLCFAYTAKCQLEGKVYYNVEYTSCDTSTESFISMLPKECILYIKNNQFRFNQAIAGGGSQSFISNTGSNTSTLVMQFMGQRFQVNLDRSNLEQLELAQKLKIIEGNKTKEICGHSCKEAFAISGKDTLQIFYAPHIETINFLPQFADLKGLPLQYEMVSEQLRIQYTCNKAEEKEICDEVFEVTDDVPIIPFAQFAQSFAITKDPAENE